MRELLNRDVLHRVKGKPALEKRARGLLRAVHRYGKARATTHADILWCARTIDALNQALDLRPDRFADGESEG